MTLKKLLLIAFIGIIPAQSLALTFNQKIALAYGGVIAVGGAIAGYAAYQDYKDAKNKREFWNNKTDDEIAQLAIDFRNNVEKRLAIQLKKLRTYNLAEDDYIIRGNLNCSHFIGDAINESDIWLTRLKDRALNDNAYLIQILKDELIQLYEVLEIYIDKDFMSELKQTPVFVPVNVPCYYPYRY